MPRIQMNQKIAVSIVFVVGMFMNILDTTIVNVAIPAIGADFGVDGAQVSAVAVGYLVSLAVFIPASGWLGDRFGNKRIYLLALAIFTVASALCGMADTLEQLVAYRVLQGVGGGMLMPVGMSMLFRTYPPAERIRASRVLVIPTAIAPALGPVVGGFLVTNVSWHWVFYLNVPIGIAAVIFGYLCIAEDRESTVRRFDLPGFVLSAAGLAGVMFALSEGARLGWASPEILIAGLGGLVLLALLVLVEVRSKAPLLDLALFGNRLFRSANLVIMCAIGGFLGAMYLLPLLLQQAMGLSAFDSGLATFPSAIGVMVASQLVAKYYPVIGPKRLLMAGTMGVAAVLVGLSFIGPDTNLWWVRIGMLVMGLCMAHVFIPAQAAAFATIPKERTGGGSTLFNVQRQVGSALGVAILASVVSALGAFTAGPGGVVVANYDAYKWGFLAAAAIALIGTVLATTIVDSDAASTMVRESDLPKRAVEPETEVVGADLAGESTGTPLAAAGERTG